MFRLQIRHRTTYKYAEPVQFGRHRLVLRPREGHDLRILDMRLLIEPVHRLTWARDVHGNSLALVDFDADATSLSIINEVTIERHRAFPEKRFHEPAIITWPVIYPVEEIAIVNGYRTLSFPDEGARVEAWLQQTLTKRSDDAEGMMLDLCRRLHETITYRRRTEKGVQSPLQTIQEGSGSCRDMATLMMECVRLLGVAARFASGYLHGSASLAGRASTHAWIEIYLPSLGWRGFDPTMGKETGLQHIATGVSQHPRGVMPVSGTFSGPNGSFQSMEVDVLTQELEVAAEPAAAG